MKTRPIIADPATFLKAGIHSMHQAAVLVFIGRCGLLGARVDSCAAALRLSVSTVQGACNALNEMGLITRISRSNRQGRAFSWVVTRTGWELLITPAEVDLFPGAIGTLKGVEA